MCHFKNVCKFKILITILKCCQKTNWTHATHIPDDLPVASYTPVSGTNAGKNYGGGWEGLN